MCGTWVGRPDRDLLTGRVDDDRPGLHERGDEPLLAVLALDDDAVGRGPSAMASSTSPPVPCSAESSFQKARLVGAEVGVGEHLVLRGLLQVEDRGQLLVVDVDELGRVARLGRRPGDDDGHDLTGAGHPLDRHRQVRRGLLVRR